MKIDVFAHILPVKYREALQKENLPPSYRRMHETPTLFDIDQMSRTGSDLRLVASLASADMAKHPGNTQIEATQVEVGRVLVEEFVKGSQ